MTVFARKKPVTIECMKWTGENSVEVKYDGERLSLYVGAKHQRLSC